MKKIFRVISYIIIIAFVIWGIITVNIINTDRISGGEYNINNSQYKQLYTEIEDNIFGFVTDNSVIKIRKADYGYIINFYNNKYMFDTSKIKSFSEKLNETEEILHRGIENIKMSLIGGE